MAGNDLENKDKIDDIEITRNGVNTDKKGNKSKKGLADKIISLVILIVCTAGLIYSGSKLYKWVLNNINSNKIATEINTLAGVPNIPEDENPGAEFGINFEQLLAYNPDVVGWIRVPGTSVNYSLLQGETNQTYLRHSIDRSYNDFGWPFMDSKNTPDFTDKNTVLYGHNIVSGLMFADLLYIYNGVLGTDVEIDIYRKDYRLLEYKVFSAYVIDPETYYLTTTFATDEQYSTFLSTMMSRSVIDFHQTVGVDDNIITLQTCTSDAKRRVIIHAKLVSNTEMPR